MPDSSGNSISVTPKSDRFCKSTDAMLCPNEERYRAILEAAMDGYWMTDIQGRLLDVNSSYCRMTGYSKRELLRMNLTDLEAAEESEEIDCRMERIRTFGEGRFRTRHRRKNESIFDVEVSARYLSVAGKVIVFFGREITEQKQPLETFQESEHLLRHLTDNLPNVMLYQITIEPDGVRRFSFVSRAVERLNEVTVEQAMTDAGVIYGQLLPEYADLIRHKEEQVLKCPSTFRAEVQSRLPSGRLRWFEITSTLRFQADGRHIWDGVQVDITERKQAEQALRESEERFRTIFEEAQQGIVIVSPEFKFEKVNPAFCRMVGYSDEELYDLSFADITHPDHIGQDMEGVQKVALGETFFYRTEKRYIHKNGQTIWADITVSAVRDAPWTDLRYFLTMIYDITVKKQAEQEKAELEAQLQQAQKLESVGRLAGGVAHDFNNMLGVILGYAEMGMSKVTPSDALYGDLSEIITAAKRSAKVTRQLLTFARKQTVMPQVLDLNETVTDMHKMLERIIGEEIHLAWCPGAVLWPVKVDPSQIDQILANLCVNARDAINGSGTITIITGNIKLNEDFCSAHPGCIPGEYVRLVVGDDGSGINQDTLPHIFEPFFTTKGVGEGTGLGLAMVYGAVRQNNGFITAESTSEKGTNFTIYLPRYLSEHDRISAQETPGILVGGGETILLVEDEPAVLALTTKMLTRQGHKVLAASTPKQAIDLAREHPAEIHLLISDVIMPGINGRELWRRIKALRPQMKCLYMSGYPDNAIAHHGVLEAGAHFIQKPFAGKELAAKVRTALEEK